MTAGETYASWDDRDATYASRPPEFARARDELLPSGGGPTPPRPTPPNRKPTRDTFWQRAMRKRRDLPVWKETLIVIGVLLVLAIIVRTFLFQAYYIPSSSMEGGITVGDRVMVNKVAYDFREPKRGEIVVFRGTASWPPENATDNDASLFSRVGTGFGSLIGISQPSSDEFIKRVIGLPGDTVACCDSSGRVTVNGVGIDEPYVTMNAPIVDITPSTPSCSDRNFRPILVQPGMMFVMGDRRLVSQDSRCNGQVPLGNVVGEAVSIVWPVSHWTDFDTPPTFKQVPAPEAAAVRKPIPIDADSSAAVVVFPLLSAFGLAARSRTKWKGKGRKLRA